VVFVVLLTRVILSYKLDFLIPLSKVDENMKVAQKRDAVLQGMFYFRKDICKGITFSWISRVTYFRLQHAAQAPVSCPLAGGTTMVDGYSKAQNSTEQAVEEYTLMSIDTIINGKVGALLHAPHRLHPWPEH